MTIAVALHSGCGRATDVPEIPEIRSGLEVLVDCPPDSSIPAEFTGATATYAAGLASEVSRFVQAGHHPSLWCGDAPGEAYRALWLPAYRPALMTTLIRTEGGWNALATTFVDPRRDPGYRGSVLSTVALQHEAVVTKGLSEFLASLDAAKAWTIPAWRQSSEVDDGATWVMEMRRDHRYRMITRGNVPDSKFEESVRQLLRVANITVPDEMLPPTHPR